MFTYSAFISDQNPKSLNDFNQENVLDSENIEHFRVINQTINSDRYFKFKFKFL